MKIVDDNNNMKRLLILADTHYNLEIARLIIEHSGPLDGFVHLGDFVRDAHELQEACGLPLWAVSGNHDWCGKEPHERVFEVGGARLLACHGDRYDLTAYISDEEWEENFAALLRRGRSQGAGCVLFGHSHVPMCKEYDELLVMNPGSMCLGDRLASYGMLEIADGCVRGRLCQVVQDDMRDRAQNGP